MAACQRFSEICSGCGLQFNPRPRSIALCRYHTMDSYCNHQFADLPTHFLLACPFHFSSVALSVSIPRQRRTHAFSTFSSSFAPLGPCFLPPPFFLFDFSSSMEHNVLPVHSWCSDRQGTDALETKLNRHVHAHDSWHGFSVWPSTKNIRQYRWIWRNLLSIHRRGQLVQPVIFSLGEDLSSGLFGLVPSTPFAFQLPSSIVVAHCCLYSRSFFCAACDSAMGLLDT